MINRWQVGIALEDADLNVITGNWIGTTADGLAAAGNTRSGDLCAPLGQQPDRRNDAG